MILYWKKALIVLFLGHAVCSVWSLIFILFFSSHLAEEEKEIVRFLRNWGFEFYIFPSPMTSFVLFILPQTARTKICFFRKRLQPNLLKQGEVLLKLRSTLPEKISCGRYAWMRDKNLFHSKKDCFKDFLSLLLFLFLPFLPNFSPFCVFPFGNSYYDRKGIWYVFEAFWVRCTYACLFVDVDRDGEFGVCVYTTCSPFEVPRLYV